MVKKTDELDDIIDEAFDGDIVTEYPGTTRDIAEQRRAFVFNHMIDAGGCVDEMLTRMEKAVEWLKSGERPGRNNLKVVK